MTVEQFHNECKARGINPRNVLFLFPNGSAIVEGTVRVQCTNGIYKLPKKKR